MRIAVLLAARTVSKRLPHKVLRLVKGQTVLHNTMLRLQKASRPDFVVMCTSVEPADDILADTAEVCGWHYFRGSGEDVLKRFYEAAKTVKAEIIVRATADNMLVCPKHIDWLIDKHVEAGADWSAVDGLPHGLRTEVISFPALERAYRYAEDTSMSEYMTWFFDQAQVFRTLHVPAKECYQRPTYRLTLDAPADLQLIRALCDRFEERPPEISTDRIIALLDRSPDLVKINALVPDRLFDMEIRAGVNTKFLDTPQRE
jgi:spore coat polysaccharide biosynthesis protein SpsF (cytidylyltransferase family)